MTDDQEEKTIRLLNIIDSVALLGEGELHLDPPFSVDAMGALN